LASESFPVACACYGWCLQNGQGIPVNFTEATKYFQRAADRGNADGANSLAVCLDLGRGLEQDPERSTLYYHNAASQHHPAGMNNIGRCLEYGQAIAKDVIRAAKYYRLSADLKNADGANNFGICLERGLGVKANIDLAAEYYRKAADAGHADGSNNFGFCLEHGRGVAQNIELAAEYYGRAADCGHPEAEQNYQRCLRLLGLWRVPDRSSVCSEQKPVFEETQVIEVDPWSQSLKAFAETRQLVTSIDGWNLGGIVGQRERSVVKLAEDQERKLKRAVKIPRGDKSIPYFERESSIHKQLNHPLIVGFEGYIQASEIQHSAIVMEFVPNGTLADHLPWHESSDRNAVSGETRIAMIVTGIVLAMRYLHSRGIIHRDLKPESVFVDWDWIVRIGNFGNSILSGESLQKDTSDCDFSPDARYGAPESFKNSSTLESDVFSFGIVLCELLSGQPGFSRELSQEQLMKLIIIDEARPVIPDFLCSDVKQLIHDCFEENADERPSFAELLFRLDKMDFRITPGVNSEKVRRFVDAVKSREKELGIEIEDIGW
jgi:TPR repeat protein